MHLYRRHIIAAVITGPHHRLRHRPHLGRQRHPDRDRADRDLPAHPAAGGRHRRLPRRRAALGRGHRPLGRRQHRLPARRDDPGRLDPRRDRRHQPLGQGAAEVPPLRARRGPDRLRDDADPARTTSRRDRAAGDRRRQRHGRACCSAPRRSRAAAAPRARGRPAARRRPRATTDRLPAHGLRPQPARQSSCATASARSWTQHVYPNEAEALRALDEEVTVESGRAYPADPGRDPRAGPLRGPLEPVHARRRARRRPDQLGVRRALRGDGPQPGDRPDGVQLLGPRHRQLRDPRRARHRGAAGALAARRCSTARSAPASR